MKKIIVVISGTTPRCHDVQDLNETPTVLFNPSTQVESLEELLCILSSQRADGPKNPVNVCREDIFEGGILVFDVHNTKFKPEHELFVRFTSEEAIDTGGPMREFMRLMMLAVRDSVVFEGPLDAKSLALDQNGRYIVINR